MDATTITIDVAVAATAFATTHVLYKGTKSLMATHLPSWGNVKESVQNRMACEIALLPCRLVMGICCAPIVLHSFEPTSIWIPSDTSRAILACATMAGSYCYDLTIERADILSLIHHCFGPAMLIWIRTCFSSYTSDDAVMTRLLVSFVFFGAAMGGTLTTTILVILKLLRPHLAAWTAHKSVASLVWILSLNTLIATSFGSAYMCIWETQLVEYWGYWCLIPMVLSAFEYYLQWRWAVKFQLIGDKLGLQSAAEMASTSEKAATTATKQNKAGVLDTLKSKYTLIKVVIACWLVTYTNLYLRVFHLALSERDINLNLFFY